MGKKKVTERVKPMTFREWKNYLPREYDDFKDIHIKTKTVNISEQRYSMMMRTVEEILDKSTEETVLTKHMSDETKDEVLEYILKSIQSWELYRVMWSRGINEPRDVDGVPLPVVKKMMRDVCDYDVDWGLNKYSKLSVTTVNDDEKTHSSCEEETLGEYFRKLHHQLSHYCINYKPLSDGTI